MREWIERASGRGASRLIAVGRRQRRRARALGPAYFSMVVRWVAWLSALVMVVLADDGRLATTGPFFVLTFVQTALFTTGYLLMHRPLRGLLRRPGLRRVDGRAVWAGADLLLSLGTMAATGGLWSPFHIYALTAVMFPALVFRWRGAVIAASLFAAFQVAMVVGRGGLAALGPAQQVDSFVSVTVNAYLIALFTAYLASLLDRLAAEQERTAQAWRHTNALYTVAQAILESPPEERALYARVTDAVHRHLRLTRFGVYQQAGGASALLAGYRLPPHLDRALDDCAAVPLRLDERIVSCLVGAHRGGGRAETEAVLQALAGQLALGLRNAELTRQQAAMAAEGERTRLAREIHDGVAQSLYMLTLNLEACVEVAEQGTTVRPRLEQLLGLARQALWEVRHYIFDLKPLLGGDTPLAEVLRNPLREFQTISGLPATLHTAGTERPLSPGARAAVYRVLQECLANTFKHARARQVEVMLDWGPTGLTLTVRDDGRGFDAATVVRGHGLDNLDQRAREIGGTATIESAPGAGTRVELLVPYAEAAEAAGHRPTPRRL